MLFSKPLLETPVFELANHPIDNYNFLWACASQMFDLPAISRPSDLKPSFGQNPLHTI
jgi:hypothetical protein